MGRSYSRPIIGIPCAQYPDSWYTPANGNAISYLRAIEAAGGIPALIHLTEDDEVLDAHYRHCDALLFAGGEDIHPAAYGAAPHAKLGRPNPRQDAVELRLARRAISEHKPVLGVCRGHQLLNVAMGGTLIQDIPSDVAAALDHEAGSHRQDATFLAHPITLAGDSWLAGRLDCPELIVNSLHHQALDRLAPGLHITAHAPDGVIEAVEGDGPGFTLGIQCHPEELWEGVDRRWARVFEGFVAIARQG